MGAAECGGMKKHTQGGHSLGGKPTGRRECVVCWGGTAAGGRGICRAR